MTTDRTPSRHAAPPATRSRRRRLPSFKQLLMIVAVGFLAACAALGVAYAETSIPTPNEVATSQATIVYYDDGKSEIGRFGAQNRVNVDIKQVPDHVQKAVLAAEDRSFYENQGISPTGIVRAAWNNLRGESLQGGSTITQQYAKNAYLKQERTYKRKFKEFLIAVKLDQRDDKDKILEDYLNTIYFGRGAYGIQTAASAYFGKDPSKLTVAEGAVLAAIIRSPGRYDPEDDRDRLEGRFGYVLDGMVKKGWLTREERAAVTFPEIAKPSNRNVRQGPSYYLLDVVRRELRSIGFSDQDIDLGGLRVTSTFDKRAQAAAVRAVRRERPKQNMKGVHIGLSAVEPGTGAVVAMYGGARAGGNNEVTQARLQPGSSFKPFALTAALDKGVSLRSRFKGNSPLKLPGTDKEVGNEFGYDYGYSVDLIKATADSINTAYVDLTLEIGARAVLDAAVRAGIPKDTPGLRAEATIPLGTGSVRNIDMANAYATLAARGEAAQWFTVKQVKGANGGVRYEASIKKTRVFEKDVMADVTYALQQVVKRGTGTRASQLGRPAAGKTGTAALREDTTTSSWFVGYTPQLSAAVDFYKGDGTADLDGVGGLSTFFGGNYPTRIWTAFMRDALKGRKVLDFPEPEYVGRAINPRPSPRPTSSSPSATETATVSVSPSPTATATASPAPTDATPTPEQTQGAGTDGGGGGGGGGGADAAVVEPQVEGGGG